MSKIDIAEARNMRAEGMSLRAIGRMFDATGEAVRVALRKEPKPTRTLAATDNEEPTFESITEWAIRAAQVLADEPRKSELIKTQVRQIKVLKARLYREETINKKVREQELLFRKINKGKIKPKLTYHI